MNTHEHGWTRRLTRVSMVALVTALMVGTAASPLLDGHAVEAKRKASRVSASDDVTALKFEAFSNATPIAIPSNAQTAPSTITVSGFETNIADIEVSLNTITHPSASALDVLLVGPDGQTALLMSDAGGPAANDSLTFNDQAGTQLPNAPDPLVSGQFQPTNYDFTAAPDAFAAPAPTNPAHGSALGVFNGTNPNGTWRLFIKSQSVIPGQTGSISGGWSLQITAANGAPNAAPDSFSAQAGKPLIVPANGVLGNDRDPDGDGLTAVLASQPKQGTVALQPDGGFTYKASKKAKGTDSFTYLAQDGTGLQDVETVTIQLKKAKKKGKR